MVSALEELGYRNCFDSVFGASAGSISGAYFISKQARYGTTIFYENINNKSFIDLFRIFSKSPIVSLDFLFRHVCSKEKYLNDELILNSDIPLYSMASSVERSEIEALHNFSSREELISALECSSRVPIVAGGPVKFRGKDYLDASIYESIPYVSAIKHGATDIVVLLSRPKDTYRSQANILDKYFVVPKLKKISAQIANDYLMRFKEYKKEIANLELLAESTDAPNILIVQTPKGTPNVSTRETSRKLLVDGAKEGFKATYRAMDFIVPEVVEILQSFPSDTSSS